MAFDLDPILRPGAGARSLRELAFARPLAIGVVAPHPDDFDAISLALRHLQSQGHTLQVAVLTTGASGVEDGFGGANDDEAKAALREAEQRASGAFFGLPRENLQFLRLWGRGGSDADRPEADEPGDTAPLRDWLASRPADLLFMPHGNDSNRTHRRTFEAVRAITTSLRRPAWACLNQDAKTVDMRVDLFLGFDEQDAAWKAQLLRLHASQHARNLRTRGTGFDERVLQVNRQAARALRLPQPYAEAFELLRLGEPA